MQGQQLSMFMSARDIVEKYQVLDGDRVPTGNEEYHKDYAGSMTLRRSYGADTMDIEHGNLSQYSLRAYGTADRSGSTDAGPWAWGDQRFRREARANIRRGHLETDAEVWERKSDEASYGYEPSLQDSIADEGVRHPVHLMFEPGSLGKPQVAGGHHRIAASLDVDSDKLMPVLHHENWHKVTQMRSNPDGPYKYR